MNKAQLVDAVANVVSTRRQAQAAVDTVLGAVTKSLRMGEPVTLVGFGTFMVRARKARTGRNPRTGEVIMIPAKRVPVFRAGKKLKAAIE